MQTKTQIFEDKLWVEIPESVVKLFSIKEGVTFLIKVKEVEPDFLLINMAAQLKS